MTALDQFDRLEATAIWRRSDTDADQEVLVTFGNATLTLSALDANGDRPVAHWSLGAVRQRETRGDAVVFSPDNQGSEILIVEDPLLIDALDKVLRERVQGIKKRGRRSRIKWLIGLIGICAAIYVVTPLIAVNVATRLISPERAELLSGDMIGLIEGRTGPECTSGAANAALGAIVSRLSPEKHFGVHVLDLGDNLTVPLPGHVLLDRALVERSATPEELAGWIGYAIVESEKSAATRNLFSGSKLSDILRFLSDGTVTMGAKNRAVDALMLADKGFETAAVPKVKSMMVDAKISSQAWSDALAREGISAANSPQGQGDGQLETGETAWQAIKSICNG